MRLNPIPTARALLALLALIPALMPHSALAQTPASPTVEAHEPCPPTAQIPTPDEARAGMLAARDHGFLWRITKDGRSGYLYGTVHVARLEWMYPGPKLIAALGASDTIALELDLLDPALQKRVTQGIGAAAEAGAAATPPPALPEPLRERLQRQAEAACVPAQALAVLSPQMQVAALMSLVGRRAGLDPSYGIDMMLSAFGHAAKKTVVSLETPELQLNVLQAGTPTQAADFVASSLDELESGRAAVAIQRIAQVWADADLDTLARYEQWCECIKTETDRAEMARMLDDRNPAMADAVTALHASGKQVFAAVGSLHMIGPRGLPALLASRGFTVERITAGP